MTPILVYMVHSKDASKPQPITIGPNAVETTIIMVIILLMAPRFLAPYISAQIATPVSVPKLAVIPNKHM